MEGVLFVAKFEELLEVPPGRFALDAALEAIPEWNSMAILSFIMMADEDFGVSPSPKAIKDCKTVADLLALVY